MKRIINAQNGTLEFDLDDDVEVWPCYINAKNVWSFVGGEFYRFKPFDHIMAIHVIGKNTIANPELFLVSRMNEFSTLNYSSEEAFHGNPYALSMKGMVDINFLLNYDSVGNMLYGQFPESTLQFKLDNVSVFTGWLLINVYIKRNSR